MNEQAAASMVGTRGSESEDCLFGSMAAGSLAALENGEFRGMAAGIGSGDNIAW